MAFHFQPKEFLSRLGTLARKPGEAFQQIAQDPMHDLWDLFPVAAALALLRPLCVALSGLFFASGVRLGSFLLGLLLAPLSWGILVVSAGVVSYGAFILAPRLSSQANFFAAVKLIVWGLSAYWLSMVGYLFPWAPVQILFRAAGIAGTCYLWYHGFPLLLKTPKKPPSTLWLFLLGAGCAYGTLIFLLDQLFLYTLLGPSLSRLLINP